MCKRTRQYIDQIINVGKLFEYKKIIVDLIEKIKQLGFTISTRDDSVQSVIYWTAHRIIISIEKREPLHIIWDLIHELGHLRCGEKLECSNNCSFDYDREIRAWDNAFGELSKHKILLSHQENFNNYRAYCLNSYRLIAKKQMQGALSK